MPSGPAMATARALARRKGSRRQHWFCSGVATAIVLPAFPVRAARSPGGFGDADVVAAAQPKTKSADPVVKTVPVEITFKPRPFTRMKAGK